MSEYTPDEGDVRAAYRHYGDPARMHQPDGFDAEFDRFLTKVRMDAARPRPHERDAMARAMAEHECKGKPWEQLHENVRDIYLRLADVSAAALAEARRSG